MDHVDLDRRAAAVRARRMGRDDREEDPMLGPLLRGETVPSQGVLRRQAEEQERARAARLRGDA